MKKGILIALLVVCILLLGAMIANLVNGGVWIIEGLNGKNGVDGADGKDGANGKDGVNGTDGKSAYQLAVEDGFTGTLHEWLLSLAVRGADGKDGATGETGVGVQDVKIDSDGHLIVTLTNGSVLDAGIVEGGGDPSFSDEPDEMGFYEVYEMVVMTGNTSLYLRLSPDIQNGEIYTAIPRGTVLLRTGDQKVENGYSRFLYNGKICYARSHHFEMKYNYAVSFPAYNLPKTVILTKGVQSWFYTDQIMPDIPTDIKLSYSYSGEGERVYNGDKGFAITPSATGEETLTVRIAKYEDGELTTVAVETVDVIVVEKRSDISLTGLFIGDSRISGGDMLYAITSAMPNLRLIGTRELSNSGIYHEGRAAWSTSNYLNDASSDVSSKTTANAFYNPTTECFDFAYYMEQNGFDGETLDFVVINLGANDSFSKASAENINTMVASIRAYSEDIQIMVMTEYLSPADGYYLSESSNRNVDAMRTKQFQYFTYLSDLFADREDEGIYLVPNYLAINGFRDWPLDSAKPENGTEEKIKDVVHLGNAGYKKEAAMLQAYLYWLFGA